MLQPSDQRYPLQKLMEQVDSLQEQLDNLARSSKWAEIERAQVTAIGGSQITVTYPTTPPKTRTLPYITSYTPTVGDWVRITNSRAGSAVDGKWSV